MAVSLGECMCLLRVRGWVGDLMLSDVCETSCVSARARAACVCVCVFGSANLTLNSTL